MKLVEHKVDHGEILIDQNEKILSFGVDGETIYFWGAKKDEANNSKPNKYVVLHTGDEVGENLHHVATLVDGVRPKHIFIEYIPEPEKKVEMTKIITDKGIETVTKEVEEDK